jgi:hypothetical protein
MNKNKKTFIIEKRGTSSNYTTTEYTTDDYSTENETYDYTYDYSTTNNYDETDEQKGGARIFTSIANTDYKKPKKGSKQDNYTKEDIIKQLQGYIPLKSMNDKKILKQLPLFRSWVKYIDLNTKKYRTGGLLMKVAYPDYIMLANTNQNIVWSVQLKNTILYIKDPREKISKEDEIKEKLYDMYVDGRLTVKK